MSSKKMIEANVDYQFELANRKYENLLAKGTGKKEIQEGLMQAMMSLI